MVLQWVENKKSPVWQRGYRLDQVVKTPNQVSDSLAKGRRLVKAAFLVRSG